MIAVKVAEQTSCYYCEAVIEKGGDAAKTSGPGLLLGVACCPVLAAAFLREFPDKAAA